MMAAVADTHAVIWYMIGDKRLSSVAQQFVNRTASAHDQIGVSTITLIEIVYLIERGRIASSNFGNLVALLATPSSVWTEVSIDGPVANAFKSINAAQIPEMPDRIIAATALHLGVPVITRDHNIAGSVVPTIW